MTTYTDDSYDIIESPLEAITNALIKNREHLIQELPAGLLASQLPLAGMCVVRSSFLDELKTSVDETIKTTNMAAEAYHNSMHNLETAKRPLVELKLWIVENINNKASDEKIKDLEKKLHQAESNYKDLEAKKKQQETDYIKDRALILSESYEMRRGYKTLKTEHDEALESIKILTEKLNQTNVSIDKPAIILERDNAREVVKQMLNFIVGTLDSIVDNITPFGESMWQVDKFKIHAEKLAENYNYTQLIEMVDNELIIFFDWVEYQINNIEISIDDLTGDIKSWSGPLTGIK